ncbi:hypothetical protein [uncultured Kushneria sp.]|uniref:hypothetical protein n=1 Tax=uncultured Kushneria sp. TaxID=905033 RepID=UPI002604281B|nr:hypothetical protein [uncultured Kushneria sp.]
MSFLELFALEDLDQDNDRSATITVQTTVPPWSLVEAFDQWLLQALEMVLYACWDMAYFPRNRLCRNHAISAGNETQKNDEPITTESMNTLIRQNRKHRLDEA